MFFFQLLVLIEVIIHPFRLPELGNILSVAGGALVSVASTLPASIGNHHKSPSRKKG
jgi:hypothetical protein